MVRSPPPPAGRAGLAPPGAGSAPPDPRGLSPGGAHICYGFQLRVAVPVGAVNLLQGFGHFPGAFVHHCGGVAKIQGVERQRGSGPPLTPPSCVSWGRGVQAGGLRPTFHRADKSLEVFVEFVAFVLQIRCIGGGRTEPQHPMGRGGGGHKLTGDKFKRLWAWGQHGVALSPSPPQGPLCSPVQPAAAGSCRRFARTARPWSPRFCPISAKPAMGRGGRVGTERG